MPTGIGMLAMSFASSFCLQSLKSECLAVGRILVNVLTLDLLKSLTCELPERVSELRRERLSLLALLLHVAAAPHGASPAHPAGPPGRHPQP